MRKNGKTKTAAVKSCGMLARPAGFEPTAYRLGGGRSILLSYGRTVHSIIPNAKQLCKAFL